MKTKAPLIVVLALGMTAMVNAFTLDAVGYEGIELPSIPVSVSVPGYGDLVFEEQPGSALEVDNTYLNDNGTGGPSLNFKQGESLKITFVGPQPLNVDFEFTGVSVGEYFSVKQDQFTPQAYILTLNGEGDGAGLYAVSWKVVPEPTSALLGVLGGAVFAFRRRR